jgi:hypothetical protein
MTQDVGNQPHMLGVFDGDELWAKVGDGMKG